MNKSITAIIIYILGLIFGALVLDLWSADTGPKTFIGFITEVKGSPEKYFKTTFVQLILEKE